MLLRNFRQLMRGEQLVERLTDQPAHRRVLVEGEPFQLLAHLGITMYGDRRRRGAHLRHWHLGRPVWCPASSRAAARSTRGMGYGSFQHVGLCEDAPDPPGDLAGFISGGAAGLKLRHG